MRIVCLGGGPAGLLFSLSRGALEATDRLAQRRSDVGDLADTKDEGDDHSHDQKLLPTKSTHGM